MQIKSDKPVYCVPPHVKFYTNNDLKIRDILCNYD